MCLEERNTDRRGRPPAYLASERRTRCVRRSNWLSLLSMGGASLLLAFLAVDVLAPVADALALIGLGRARGADLGSDLPHPLLVDAGDLDDLLLGARHLHVDAGRNLVDHIVAEADLQLQRVLALEGGAEAHAVDLQRVRIALRDAVGQVEDLRTRHAPHRLGLLGLVARLHLDAGGTLLDLDLLRAREGKLAFRPLHLHGLTVDGRSHACGHDDRVSADARHRQILPITWPAWRRLAHKPPQNTLHRISPPTFSSRARASDITPLGVDRMATPSPFATLVRSRTAL